MMMMEDEWGDGLEYMFSPLMGRGYGFLEHFTRLCSNSSIDARMTPSRHMPLALRPPLLPSMAPTASHTAQQAKRNIHSSHFIPTLPPHNATTTSISNIDTEPTTHHHQPPSLPFPSSTSTSPSQLHLHRERKVQSKRRTWA